MMVSVLSVCITVTLTQAIPLSRLASMLTATSSMGQLEVEVT